MYRTGLILVFSLSSLGSFAQSKESFAWYDKLTYELYLNQNWDKLIEQGNKALNAGYDYFYLRMRIGIANYNKGYYRASIPHFSKALSYNNSDPLTLEYLFYAYRFSGRLIDANLLYQKYEDQLKARDVNKMSGFITGIYSEGGLKFISPKNENYGPLKYLHGGINQQFGGRLNLYQGYMRISQNNYDYSGAPGFGPPNNDQAISKYIQNDYYLKTVVPLAFGFQMIGSLHTQSIADSTQYNNLVYSGGINANFKNIDIFILYGQGKIKNIVQNQITGGLTIYPTKNQNLYLNSELTYHKDNEVENTIFYQKVGLRLGNKIWVETYGSFGDMKNVQEFDGFYLYNINDHLIRRIGLTGIFTLGQSTRLLIGYSSENYEETSTRFPYKQHYIFTGLHILLKK